jgi:hypothetical protein
VYSYVYRKLKKEINNLKALIRILGKRHVIMVNRCCMCKRNGESVDHLLHCDVASALWSALFTHFGMSWVMPRRVIDLFACWRASGRPRSAVISKMVLACIFWVLMEGTE